MIITYLTTANEPFLKVRGRGREGIPEGMEGAGGRVSSGTLGTIQLPAELQTSVDSS